MAERRADQERHYHKQIWTKQPHGGPYVKVGHPGSKCWTRHEELKHVRDMHRLLICRSATSERVMTRCASVLMDARWRWSRDMSGRSMAQPPTSWATT